MLKRFVKRLLRPLARPVLRRIDARVSAGMMDAEALKAFIPVLLNAVAAQNAAARTAKRDEVRLQERIARIETRLASIAPDSAPGADAT
jgi:uncharacterized protein YdgA (DUF945 family)